MKLKSSQHPRGELNLPLIYFIVTGTCAILGYVLYLMKQIPSFPCIFKVITGYPCPTCGATRVLKCLFQLDIVSAFLWNPMLFLLGVAFLAWGFSGFYMLFPGKKMHIILTEKEKRLLRRGLILLFFLNWIYLVAAGI